MNTFAWTLVAALVGLIVGWLGHYLWSAGRPSAAAERWRADLAEAQREAAQQAAVLARAEARWEQATAERELAATRTAELLADRDTMLAQYKALSQTALEQQTKATEATAHQRLLATEQLMTPMRQSLERFETRLIEVEKQRVHLATDLANQVKAVQLTGEQLRRETSSLEKALRQPAVRGAWGELQLKRVVELAGMVEHCDFDLQQTAATDSGLIRPDLKVHLTGGKFIYVDAKTPLSAFLDAQEADNESERQRHLTDFARLVRSHVDALSAKRYWQADAGSPEFVVLFIPSEALAQAAFQASPDLIEHAAGKNIVIATPTTLIVLLRTVAHAWSQAALTDSARQISALGRELHDRLTTMGGHFDKLGRGLAGAVKSYNETVASLETRVLVSARRLRDLKVTDQSLDQPNPIESTPRPLTAPELVDQANPVTPLATRQRRSGLELDDPAVRYGGVQT
ncbi:MAG: DNA recombination protein RmuC [Propionibacteriaceae bacterium]|jgi:DNA recombination protein RmuC|nr:DNA recombination protein RmuC [Propionibacteriaceae bacterium]